MQDDPEDLLFSAQEDVVVCDVDGGSALLDLNSSKYFSLNDTGALIWQKLQTGSVTVDQLADAVTAHYDVAREICLPDIVSILDTFCAAGLVEKSAA